MMSNLVLHRSTRFISEALLNRFASHGNADYANRIISAMSKQFGGHDEQKTES